MRKNLQLQIKMHKSAAKTEQTRFILENYANSNYLRNSIAYQIELLDPQIEAYIALQFDW